MGLDAESGHKVTSSVVGSAGVSPTVSRSVSPRRAVRGASGPAAAPWLILRRAAFQPPYFRLGHNLKFHPQLVLHLTVPPPPLTGSIPKSLCFSSAVPR